MGQIRLGIKYKSASLGSVTIDPATAASQNATIGFSNAAIGTVVNLVAGGIYAEIYNAGMTNSGGDPGTATITIGGVVNQLQVGQRFKMEAILDPVTNKFHYLPLLIIAPQGSMVEYHINYPV